MSLQSKLKPRTHFKFEAYLGNEVERAIDVRCIDRVRLKNQLDKYSK